MFGGRFIERATKRIEKKALSKVTSSQKDGAASSGVALHRIQQTYVVFWTRVDLPRTAAGNSSATSHTSRHIMEFKESSGP